MLKKNKILKIISNIIYSIFILIMAVLIITVARERMTGKEPSLFGYKLYIVESGSMTPTLKINSLIVVKPKPPNEIKIGDIITYNGKETGIKVTHRVVDIGEGNEYFITRGDANNTEDPLPVEKERIVGRLVFSIAYLGYIFKFLTRSQGLIFLIVGGLAWMILPIIFRKRQVSEM